LPEVDSLNSAADVDVRSYFCHKWNPFNQGYFNAYVAARSFLQQTEKVEAPSL